MPGPFLDLILEQVRESDKDNFRKKILAQERTEAQVRAERGEMTREMVMKADAQAASQFSLELEEREQTRELNKQMLKDELEGIVTPAKKDEEKKEEVAPDMKKFMEQFR